MFIMPLVLFFCRGFEGLSIVPVEFSCGRDSHVEIVWRQLINSMETRVNKYTDLA